MQKTELGLFLPQVNERVNGVLLENGLTYFTSNVSLHAELCAVLNPFRPGFISNEGRAYLPPRSNAPGQVFGTGDT